MKLEREFFYDEVRDGFYIPGIIKRLWGAELTVLSELDRICKKYRIPYYIAGGALLGAVRDGQFIPWDDDIDIMMFRRDFEVFTKVVHDELPDELSFLSLSIKEDFYSFFSTVWKGELGGREKILKKYSEYPYPVSVDIFILDELSGNQKLEEDRRQRLEALLSLLIAMNQGEESQRFQLALKRATAEFRFSFSKTLPLKDQLYKKMNEIFQEENGKGGEEISCIPWHVFQEEYRLPKDAFSKTKYISLCNIKFPAPEGYNAVLRAEYGDYHRKVKAGGAHNYPYFKKYEKELNDKAKMKWKKEYSFSEEDLRRPEIQNFRDLAMLTVEAFYSALTELMDAIENREFPRCLSKLATMQEEAITFGNAIEQKKGEGTKSVSVIEEYCEALFELYQSISEQGARGDFSKVSVLFGVGALQKEMKTILTSLENLRVAVQKDFKKQVIFLPHSAKHFESLRPLVDAMLEEEELECKIIPIPYYDKCGDGRLKEIHYEGEDFPKGYEIVDYNCYDFSVELPDCIVINSPYDEFNPVWTVDSAFYSKELKKYSNKLIYIPWFVTDEIDPKNEEDGKAFTNMEYYVTVPGLFHSDFTIVQSEGMKKAYLAKIEEFAGKDVAKKMEKKISGAGSCLLGDKEGQGIKEVVKEFKNFL